MRPVCSSGVETCHYVIAPLSRNWVVGLLGLRAWSSQGPEQVPHSLTLVNRDAELMISTVREQVLVSLAESFADLINEVDQRIAERRDYGPGIGPHREQNQLAALVERMETEHTPITQIKTELPYPGGGERCDLVVSTDDIRVPIEAKLLRFRRANGNDESEGYAKVFSPVKPSGS